ncbi:MAG: D-alanine--D-alanine ligase [Acidiferrobacterales bacterium]|nr:D-alanine--D-alanine ligase [Acidiferrobacterales bacterium]
MKSKIRVGILFGGKSAEHEVSLQSAKSIVEAINKNKYDVVLLGIDKSGQWHLNEASTYLLDADNPKLIALNKGSENVTLVPGVKSERNLVSLAGAGSVGGVDVVFPILHGPYGEDGTVQGLLKMADVPFVGSDVLGAAVSMDKDVMKRLFKEAAIPTPRFRAFYRRAAAPSYKDVVEALGSPMFVKPANLGSSVGVAKVRGERAFDEAVADAFRYDHKILVEQSIAGREIECSVLGNEDPIASIPGEVRPTHEFYSYDAKYIDEQGAELIIPAQLPAEVVKRVQELAVAAFKVLCCAGMARVDFFVTADNDVYVNELNSIPGFTKISMYPKLWEASGIPYPELIDRLIQLALQRADRDQQLKTSKDL